jgi:helicase
MVREGELLGATVFGKTVSDLYIDPQSAVVIRDALPNYKPEKSFGVLHMICSVPDMPLLYLRQTDYEWIEEFEGERVNELLIQPPSDLNRYEIFLAEIKTAKLLNDWISEIHENEIADAFKIGPGDIRNKMDMAEWLIHASVRLAGLFNPDAVADVSELRTRIEYGIKAELLELVKLRGIGRVRARALHDRDLKSIEDLRTTSYDRLKQIPTIGEAIARLIKSQLGQVEPGMPVDVEDKQRLLEEYR